MNRQKKKEFVIIKEKKNETKTEMDNHIIS